MKKRSDFLIITVTLIISSCIFNSDSTEASIPLEMIFIEGGLFVMGDRFGEGDVDELPLHNVNLDSFFISKHEITQNQFKSKMGSNPSYNKNKNFPVETVSFFQIIKFCNYLSVNEGLIPHYSINGETNPDSLIYEVEEVGNNGLYKISGLDFDWSANGYRLPTEAEWEYAARGGIFNEDNYRYSGCTSDDELPNYAWFNDNQGIRKVGEKNPNQLGLYDMTGNVFEICHDGYSADYYNSSPVDNPTGPDPECYLVMRGGAFNTPAFYCRVANREMCYREPEMLGQPIGFRVVKPFN